MLLGLVEVAVGDDAHVLEHAPHHVLREDLVEIQRVFRHDRLGQVTPHGEDAAGVRVVDHVRALPEAVARRLAAWRAAVLRPVLLADHRLPPRVLGVGAHH
eukprot:10523499-Alexandrium_andersonii.AAC.2